MPVPIKPPGPLPFLRMEPTPCAQLHVEEERARVPQACPSMTPPGGQGLSCLVLTPISYMEVETPPTPTLGSLLRRWDSPDQL